MEEKKEVTEESISKSEVKKEETNMATELEALETVEKAEEVERRQVCSLLLGLSIYSMVEVLPILLVKHL